MISPKTFMYRYKFIINGLFLFLLILGLSGLVNTHKAEAATSPYNVPSSVLTNWYKIKGDKHYSNAPRGTRLIYDVYSKKYTKGGYQIVSRNFGNGTKQYVNFQGYAIIQGHRHHTASNNETYIVAEKKDGTTVKLYSTLKKDVDATWDFEYGDTGSGLQNACPNNAINKYSDECNMYYENVGFDAYLPISDLFGAGTRPSEWELYIVKAVAGHIVYDELVVPFEFEKLNYNGGTIQLTSGINTNSLEMYTYPVLRRSYIAQTATSVQNELGEDRYFRENAIYQRVDSIETTDAAIWFGVRSPHDGGATKWANSAYWNFAGSQAVLKFEPEDDPPIHISHHMALHQHENGNDYWTQPNNQVIIDLRQQDHDTGNKYQYIKLAGSGQDVRARHYFTGSTTDITRLDGFTSPHLSIDSARRTENNTQGFGRVEWKVTPKTHGQKYDILYYYVDNADNAIGYNDTGMNLKVDGVAPTEDKVSITGALYENGNTYWTKSDSIIKVTIGQTDLHSGNRNQHIQALDLNNKNRIETRTTYLFSLNFADTTVFGSNLEITDFNRKSEGLAYKEVTWNVKGKGHGNKFLLQSNLDDNVGNATGYKDKGIIAIDDKGPEIAFRNTSDNKDFVSRDWDDKSIDVRLKHSDGHSGYKRSRYAWTKSEYAPNNSSPNWSEWTTDNDYVVTKKEYGEWYLHVQSEDNVSNITTTTKGPYKFNNIPEITLDFSPTSLFEGDTVKLKMLPTDKDDNKLSVTLEMKVGNGEWQNIYTRDNVYSDRLLQHSVYNLTPTNYQFRATVKDEHGASGQDTISFTVNPLKINGYVDHTLKWEQLHQELGNAKDQFYSGERFLLTSAVTDHPIEFVEVTIRAKQINGSDFIRTIRMTPSPHPLYKGEMYSQSWSNVNYKLQGKVDFIFEAKWKNGVRKFDQVTVQIIDDVYGAFDFYRSS